MQVRNTTALNRLSNVDIRLLRIFRIVADCGGFSASEFELDIGRSTISRHISDLETRTGVKLCNRGPGGFSLTRDGENVLNASNKLLDAINAFQNEINDIHRNLRGTLRFAFFDLATGNPDAHLQQAIRLFTKEAPDVEIEIFTEPPNVIESGVIKGIYDLGIVPLHRRSNGLDYHKLYQERMVLCCGKDHPLYRHGNTTVKKENLSTYKYAGFGFNSPNMMAGQNLGLHLAARVHNEEALTVLLLSGHYLGFLPEHVAASFVDTGELKPVGVKNTNYTTTLSAIVRRKPEPGRKATEFLKCLKTAHERV